MDAHANFAYSTVATAPSPASSGTTLTVASGDGAKFPAAPFNVTVWPAGAQPSTTNAEIVRVTSKGSGDNWTIARTQESSSARSILVGDQIAATITKKVITDIEYGLLPVVNVENYGAVHDGSTDDSTAINNAIAALPTTGGIVYFPAGDYAVASTINIGNGTSSAISTRQGIYLYGAAGPVVVGQAAIGLTTYGAVRLLWTGSAHGTVVSVKGPLVGWGLRNIYIRGASSADYGLYVQSAQGGVVENLAVHGCQVGNIYSQTVAVFSGNVTNTMHNDWRNIFLAMPTIAGSTRGLFLGGTSSSNACFERFTNLSINVSDPGVGNAAYGVLFKECDNITISGLHLACSANAGTYYPVFFNYAGALASQPADNLIEHVDFGSHYTAVVGQTGTPSGAYENKIVAISGGNSGGVPANPALANLAWGYTASDP